MNESNPTISILSTKHQRFAKSKNNYSNSDEKQEKKAVRFADSLGLELESIITVQNTDDSRRRTVRINMPPTNPYVYHKNQFIQANNNIYQSAPKYNFAKAYTPGIVNNSQNLNNITHFNNGKMLRHQGHEARKYLEGNSRNQFEDMQNGASLYDEIVNKIAFGADGQYRQARGGNHIYENEMLNGYNNRQQASNNNRVYLSNSEKNLVMRNAQNIGNYHMVNPGQQQQLPPNNVTITTRINNGKLESEV